MADIITDLSGLSSASFYSYFYYDSFNPGVGEYGETVFQYRSSTGFPTDSFRIVAISGQVVTIEFNEPNWRGGYDSAKVIFDFTLEAHNESLLILTNVSIGTRFILSEIPVSANDLIAVSETGQTGTVFNYEYLGNGETEPVAPFDIAIPCFAEGTLVATPEGERPVETLAEGDVVLTASGEARAIKWVGTSLVRPSRRRNPQQVNPVRIRAGAFGESLPARDLRVSPGHAIFVDGVLIPAGLLVNGATIVQEEVDEIRYYHVELESHDVLLAEGLPCESYLDDGNRSSFANAGEHAVLNGRLDPKSWDDACAPMVAAGPQLAAVQASLAVRAEELGWVKSEDADLRLVVDGAELAPIMARGNRFWFQAPAASSLRLASNSGVLAHVIPGLAIDGRRLGVAIADLRVNGVGVDLEGEAFGEGFHMVERFEDAAWRWTDGDAALGLVLDAPSMIEVALHMVAPSWTRPAAGLAIAA